MGIRILFKIQHANQVRHFQPSRLALHFTGGRCMAGTYLGTSCFAVRHSSRAIGRGMILDGTNRWKEPAVVCATVLPPQRYALM